MPSGCRCSSSTPISSPAPTAACSAAASAVTSAAASGPGCSWMCRAGHCQIHNVFSPSTGPSLPARRFCLPACGGCWPPPPASLSSAAVPVARPLPSPRSCPPSPSSLPQPVPPPPPLPPLLLLLSLSVSLGGASGKRRWPEAVANRGSVGWKAHPLTVSAAAGKLATWLPSCRSKTSTAPSCPPAQRRWEQTEQGGSCCCAGGVGGMCVCVW